MSEDTHTCVECGKVWEWNNAQDIFQAHGKTCKIKEHPRGKGTIGAMTCDCGKSLGIVSKDGEWVRWSKPSPYKASEDESIFWDAIPIKKRTINKQRNT